LLKGAAIGLVFGAILCLECATEYRLQTALGYAVMGVTIDALQSHAKTIYEGAPRPSLGVRIRF
jgi:hypothetical protein